VGFTGNPRDRHEWIDPPKPKIRIPEGFKKVPGEKFVAISRVGEVINSETGLSMAIRADGRQERYIYIYDADEDRRVRYISDMIRETFVDAKESIPVINHRERKISISNPPLMREALMQIQATKGRHYPGPLRDQTVWDAVDYLVRQLEELDRGNNG
jgi:hypothetical protein